jgi:hypothetical protein
VSKLIYEWISGFQRKNEDGEPYTVHQCFLEMFRNFDQFGNRSILGSERNLRDRRSSGSCEDAFDKLLDDVRATSGMAS